MHLPGQLALHRMYLGATVRLTSLVEAQVPTTTATYSPHHHLLLLPPLRSVSARDTANKIMKTLADKVFLVPADQVIRVR